MAKNWRKYLLQSSTLDELLQRLQEAEKFDETRDAMTTMSAFAGSVLAELPVWGSAPRAECLKTLSEQPVWSWDETRVLATSNRHGEDEFVLVKRPEWEATQDEELGAKIGYVYAEVDAHHGSWILTIRDVTGDVLLSNEDKETIFGPDWEWGWIPNEYLAAVQADEG